MSNLVGKTVHHSWTQGPWAGASFVTLFCSEDTLVWNNISDPDNVSSEKETYVRAEIAPGIAQISWKEDPANTNFGLIWTLNFNDNSITGVIVNADPKANVNVSGTFEVVEGLDVNTDAGLMGC